MAKNNRQTPKTSWGPVADWYDHHLSAGSGTYHERVIWPNLERLLQIKSGDRVLDLACGNGAFARRLAAAGALVTGVDVSAELIAKAKSAETKNITYLVTPADQLTAVSPASQDQAVCVLALQNIAEVKGALAAVAAVLRSGGRFFMVLNHPAFRIPEQSAWGWDPVKKVQYRRLEQYLSESETAIVMNPGVKTSKAVVTTTSYHRPLQCYFKALQAAGLAVTRLEEWVSPKQSQPGPRAAAEDKARHEFPLFLLLEATKLK